MIFMACTQHITGVLQDLCPELYAALASGLLRGSTNQLELPTIVILVEAVQGDRNRAERCDSSKSPPGADIIARGV